MSVGDAKPRCRITSTSALALNSFLSTVSTKIPHRGITFITIIRMENRDSLDRSSSEIAIDPVATDSPATNGRNDSVPGGESPKVQHFAAPANETSPAVDNVLQSDVSSDRKIPV